MPKSFKKKYRDWHQSWPKNFDKYHVKIFAWLEAMFIDHGFLRPFYNRPQIFAKQAWRGNQPSVYQVKKLAQKGVKTLVSLRGFRNSGAALLEIDACQKANITLVQFSMSSRGVPSLNTLLDFADLLDRIDKPVFFHCKSGADRSGFAAALYLLITGEGTIEQARAQLSWKYLHFKGAKTGRLDLFLETYQKAYELTNIDFLTWLKTEYEPDHINKNFKPNRMSSLLVDKVLRRE
jgi:protein tyrosine phosphatase (PTP) superfamily phosphohydrolase (DUF442 family)